jgi:hypothetical protein
MPPQGAGPNTGTGPVVAAVAYPQPPMPAAVATYPPPVAQAASCPRCQRANAHGARFCSGCGAAL